MVESTPLSPLPNTGASNNTEIKVATPDIILFNDDAVPVEIIADLIFEDIGGQELISISRNDSVSSYNSGYHPVKNLSTIYQQYNPKNIVDIQNTSETIFNNFSIKLEDRTPSTSYQDFYVPVYIDSSGNLVIEVANIASDEQVEIQILTTGDFFNDTI